MESTTTLQPPSTIREVWESLPEGTRAQIIENQLIMSAVPLDQHQKVLNKIVRPLLNFTEENSIGEIRMAPSAIFLDEENVFEPDIVFVSKENVHKFEKDGLHGAPDLVIEILSPSTARYDKNQKKQVYERHGVKEYWIVDPETKSVEGYYLEANQFSKSMKMKGKISSKVLDYEFEF